MTNGEGAMADAEERVVWQDQTLSTCGDKAATPGAWIAKNPEADINFSGVDFSKYGDVVCWFSLPRGQKRFL